ncbi:serine/threonine-protein kinase [Crateriforma spongiae]|uniref:serine/threonine-protein kinase n=1 Tax=Crateriforma spongiae TaxID=2724528 RepID=UPI00144730E6|nr:serine/threonine-protein kinase [Crateriforma spongiae]
MSDIDQHDDRLDEAFAAYLRSCDSGEIGSREEFLSQFPDIADELRELMDVADSFGRFGGQASQPKVVNPIAETVNLSVADQNDSIADPAATLPMANRGHGDPGPTLPFDLGDYLLKKVIGRGGMGVVYLAQQKDLQRDVAVKMIRSGILADDSEVRRFYTEAQAAARLRHPGIVAVYQFGRRAGHHFFSMEFIEGTNLQSQVAKGPMDFQLAARYVRDVARAIAHAHDNGVLHRDLKPANVLIDPDDRVHVTDFGLAKTADADGGMTGSGTAVGTPHYMAPEQAGGHSDRATPQSDVYSLGAILFACITGRPPIVGDTVMQTLIRVVHDPAPALRSIRGDAPADLETIVAKCLEKQPGKRYSGAQALASDLQAYLDGQPIAARPRWLLTKAWHWIEGVPVVAAIMGRRRFHTTDQHRRLQTAMLTLMMFMPMFVVGLAWWRHHLRHSMPDQVVLAGGMTDGVYTDVSNRIARRLASSVGIQTQVVPTGGSLENQQRLVRGEVNMAPLQASAVSGDPLCVIAPLFYEVVHVMVRRDSGIQTLDDFAGHRVAVGPKASGSRVAAEMVFDSLGYGLDDPQRDFTPWYELRTDLNVDIAVVCMGRGNRVVRRWLQSGQWQLMEVPRADDISLEHPTLRPMRISAADYQGCNLPDSGVRTVGTMAFLATQIDAPDPLVQQTLEVLYEPPLLVPGMIHLSQTTEWQGLSFHPAARRFFESKAVAAD